MSGFSKCVSEECFIGLRNRQQIKGLLYSIVDLVTLFGNVSDVVRCIVNITQTSADTISYKRRFYIFGSETSFSHPNLLTENVNYQTNTMANV